MRLRDSKDNAQDPVYFLNTEEENTTKNQALLERKKMTLLKEKTEKINNKILKDPRVLFILPKLGKNPIYEVKI